MKVDGRKLSRAKLEEARFEAVRRVQAGEAPTAVARDMDLYTNRIFIWLAAYRSGGWGALRSRKAMGRPKRLDAKQIRWVYNAVTTKNPLQFRLPFALWTRAQVLGSRSGWCLPLRRYTDRRDAGYWRWRYRRCRAARLRAPRRLFWQRAAAWRS